MIIGNCGVLSSGKSVTTVYIGININKISPRKRIISNMDLNLNYTRFTNEEFLKFYDRILDLSEKERDFLLKRQFFNTIWLNDEIENLVDARLVRSKKTLNTTQFITLLGKLDCDLIYNAQIFNSQVDLRLRGLTNCLVETERVYMDGSPVIMGSRILEEPILIKIKGQIKVNSETIIEFLDFFNPQPYYKYYNTRQVILTK